MVAVQELEHFIDDEGFVQPDLYLVENLEPTPNHYAPEEIIERQTGVEVSKATGDVLVGVIVVVNGQPYEMRVNVSRKTLGNGQTLETFFQRFESRDVDASALAAHALHLATR